MPACRACGEFFSEKTADVMPADIERLYRAVADGEPKLEILHIIYELFGTDFDLSPPALELRTADRVNAGRIGSRG